MESYIFKTDGGKAPISRHTSYIIKFRAKPCNDNEKLWVEGTYTFIDNNKNQPFDTTPIIEKHYITSYYSGDWNMGTWEQNEIYANTLQQYTNVNDENNVNVYEGDIVSVFDLNDNKINDDVVAYENGSFYLPSNELFLHDLKNKYKIYVIGNIFDTFNHPISREYHTNTLYNNFIKNKKSTYPYLIEYEFMEFAKELSIIPMYNFVCYYNEILKDLTVKFKFNQKTYVIWKTFVDESDYDEYKSHKYNATILYKGNIEKIFESENINEIINNVIEYMK